MSSLEDAAAQMRPADAVFQNSTASTSGSTGQSLAFLPDFVPYTHQGGCAPCTDHVVQKAPSWLSVLHNNCHGHYAVTAFAAVACVAVGLHPLPQNSVQAPCLAKEGRLVPRADGRHVVLAGNCKR